MGGLASGFLNVMGIDNGIGWGFAKGLVGLKYVYWLGWGLRMSLRRGIRSRLGLRYISGFRWGLGLALGCVFGWILGQGLG